MAMGRPRAFDIDEALDQALRVFLKKGYEGASLADLTEAMGINPPSLYAAFGNKEGLFHKALDRYIATHACVQRDALAAPTAREVAERLLRASIESQTDKNKPPGCLLVQGALTCSDTAASIKQTLIERRTESEVAIRKRFERARREGDLPPDADPTTLARYITTMVNGLAVQAAGGAGRKDLLRIVDSALQAFPAKPTVDA
jgi:AcrR family transcriptional regulator